MSIIVDKWQQAYDHIHEGHDDQIGQVAASISIQWPIDDIFCKGCTKETKNSARGSNANLILNKKSGANATDQTGGEVDEGNFATVERGF